jgi:NAD(P)-dependent dehydrogenase (short-subunit alcohol dehydrogenase family)
MNIPHTRAVLVTGASTGIGEACALRLDGLGFRVFAGVRKNEDGDALKSKASSRLSPVQLDVTQDDTIRKAAGLIHEATGSNGLWGLINNAGISVNGPLEFVDVDQLRRQLEVNVIGQIAVTQAFLALLRIARGRIVNIGSNSGFLAAPLAGPYCASKFALEALTDALRAELKPWGIEVCLVEPGAIATPIWEKSIGEAERTLAAMPPEANELYGKLIESAFQGARAAARRAIPAQHVAEAVVHALTARKPKTRYLVGMDARVAKWLSRLPDRLRDRIILRYIERAM